jgi:hypothetical protein
MAQQESDRHVVPQGRRKAVATRTVEPAGGGKVATVNERTRQLQLRFETAEDSTVSYAEVDGGADMDESMPVPHATPKSRRKERRAESATMEGVIERLEEAFRKVASNKGAPGPDRQSIEEVKANFPDVRRRLETALRTGTYRPGDIRRVWIPKAGGGQRGLGIPNVVDRVVQEAVRSVLEPLYEPTFHKSSHGFRPERSCHTAIAEARSYVEEGYEWVVDLDLEKFLEPSSHYTPADGCSSKSPGSASGTLILKPFLRPRETWRASSSPRFTRCNTV